MTDSISPIGAQEGAESVPRRAADEADSRGENAPQAPLRLPAPAERQPQPRSLRASLAAFAAQMMGQGGQKRGLRGGRETLDKARSTYLETEWSGPADRRHRTGRITKTEI